MYLENLKSEKKVTHIIFKDKGTKLIGYEGITENFVLAYQSASQYDTMITENSNHIMVDSTHSTNIYGYPLITIAILTRRQRFSPFIFIITDSDSEKTLKYVFDSFIGMNLFPKTPNILMTDMAKAYFNIWSKTINKSIEWYYCNYHFKTAVKNSIDKRIHDKKLNQEIKDKFEKLKTLYTEKEFKKYYARFLTQVEKYSQSFFNYFSKTYGECIPRWAMYCRVHIEVNTDNFCESFHGSFKKEFLQSRSNHRLDSLLYALNAYDINLHLKLYLAKRSINREYLGYREITALKKHDISSKLDPKKLKRRGDVFYYTKYRIRTGLCKECGDNCEYLCRLCMICKDRYICEFLSFAIKKQMCKHIYFVHTFLNNNLRAIQYAKNKLQDNPTKEFLNTEDKNNVDVITSQIRQHKSSDEIIANPMLFTLSFINEDSRTSESEILTTNNGNFDNICQDLLPHEGLKREERENDETDKKKVVKFSLNNIEVFNKGIQGDFHENQNTKPKSPIQNLSTATEALEMKKIKIYQQLEKIKRKINLTDSAMMLNKTYEQLSYVGVTSDVLPHFLTENHIIDNNMKSRPKTQHEKLDEKYNKKKHRMSKKR